MPKTEKLNLLDTLEKMNRQGALMPLVNTGTSSSSALLYLTVNRFIKEQKRSRATILEVVNAVQNKFGLSKWRLDGVIQMYKDSI